MLHFTTVKCNNIRLLGEGYYVTFALWHEPSVCRLSFVVRLLSVTLFVALYTEG